MVGLSVLSHQTGPVHSQHYMEAVDGRIMEDHIIGPLEERGVHREDREHPLLRHPGGHRQSTAFCDPYIEESVGEGLGELIQASPAHHGGSDGADPLVPACKPGQRPAKDSGKVVGRSPLWPPGERIEGSYPVESVRILLGRQKAFPLYRLDVEQHRLIQVFRIP